MEQEAISAKAMEAITAVAYGKPGKAVDILNEVGEHGTSADMFRLCCSFALAAREAIKRVKGIDENESGLWVLRDDEDEDAADTWALRFLTVYCNRDIETALALFLALIAEDAPPDLLTEAISSLLGMSARVCKDAVDGRRYPDDE